MSVLIACAKSFPLGAIRMYKTWAFFTGALVSLLKTVPSNDVDGDEAGLWAKSPPNINIEVSAQACIRETR